MSQIDYMFVQKKLKIQLKNCKTQRPAELGLGHFLVIANIDIKPCVSRLHRKDDVTIMSTVFEKLQLSTEELQAACRKWGMEINFSKCKVITPSDKYITVEGEEMWESSVSWGP